jgi:hypothetical protein
MPRQIDAQRPFWARRHRTGNGVRLDDFIGRRLALPLAPLRQRPDHRQPKVSSTLADKVKTLAQI